jgi:putative OPT family oligopeptide transporter
VADQAPFRAFVPDEATLPELTLRALVLGSLLGLVFGASSAYLGLKVGITVSASVPIAVVSITVFRSLSKALGSRASILENNIVQTAGSAGESIAGGVIFTIPALIFLGFGLDWTRTMILALTGGILGILMMIPLRRYLIVKEHGILTYPEGTACAEVLIAGEKGGSDAHLVFAGLGAGLLHRTLMAIGGFWKEFPEKALVFYNRAAVVSMDAVPELLGVGYIIGYRSASVMVAGGALASLVLIPAIAFFGDGRATPLYPATTLISDMSPDDIWASYIRYVGAGAVAAGGIFSLARSFPTIVDSFAASFRDLRLSREGKASSLPRTERDIPINWVLIGSLVLAFGMTLLPSLHVNLLAAFLIVVFGFFFSVVASRITGELGSSSCPISGMAIATLMGTCFVFVIVGWTAHADEAIALAVGGVVCIAASNAGTTSQDLKTGYLVGATPWKQQVALIVGVLTCVFVVGLTVILINESLSRTRPVTSAVGLAADPKAPLRKGPDGVTYRLQEAVGVPGIADGSYLVDPSGRLAFSREPGIGSKAAPGPQARLMSLVIRGILTRRLPWGLVLIGVSLAVVMEILGVPSLAFAVGVYLPLSSTAPIFFGGLVRRLVDAARGASESDAGPGVLFSSGLIAGGSLIGLVSTGLQFDYPPWVGSLRDSLAIGPRLLSPAFLDSSLPGLLAFAILATLLYRFARSGAPSHEA